MSTSKPSTPLRRISNFVGLMGALFLLATGVGTFIAMVRDTARGDPTPLAAGVVFIAVSWILRALEDRR